MEFISSKKLLQMWAKRRKEIYREYTETKASYTKLARKYRLTSTRIGQIINQEKKYAQKPAE